MTNATTTSGERRASRRHRSQTAYYICVRTRSSLWCIFALIFGLFFFFWRFSRTLLQQNDRHNDAVGGEEIRQCASGDQHRSGPFVAGKIRFDTISWYTERRIRFVVCDFSRYPLSIRSSLWLSRKRFFILLFVIIYLFIFTCERGGPCSIRAVTV